MADNGQDLASGAPHVVIVGGGIAGLTAAFYLREQPVRVTVLEGSSTLGGKLATAEVAGVTVDQGAEAMYTGRPRTTGMMSEVGLDDQVVLAGNTGRAIWTRGKIRPFLDRQFMSVPADMDELAGSGLLCRDGVARARQDLELPATARDGDVSVASYVGARFGQELVDRLIDPWLCGVYAGRAEELSFEGTQTPLANASRKHASLAAAAAMLLGPPLPAGEAPPTLVGSLTGGLGMLPHVLAEAVLATSPGAVVRTGAVVSELARSERGWRLRLGTAADPEYIAADAVILAVPAPAASKLLAGVPGTAEAAAGLAEIPYASVAIISLAYPREAFPGGLAGRGYSNYLSPAVDGRAVNEVIFPTVKWPHLAGEVEIVRCQIGRIGEEELLQRDDADLAALAASEFAEAIGPVGGPVATHVQRWDGSLPQYTVGHMDRKARIRASVATQPGLAVCGAAYDGVGVGMCVATARKAADQMLTWLRSDIAARSEVVS
jgi:protoporphyrinogen/coproporphyrinogen III oxidase